MTKASANLADPRAVAAFVASGLFILIATALLCGHLIQWARSGAWPSYTNSDFIVDWALAAPETKWVRIQEIINWLLRRSFAGTLYFSGIGLFYATDMAISNQAKKI